jgi:glutathione synthase/RimK-type ligase-like ATP-grasp enzyme
MIAIHYEENSFSERWLEYCIMNNISYIKISIFDNDIVRVLKDNDVSLLLAHLLQDDFRTSLITRSILLAIENAGVKVFPNHRSFWHFDDKISQKYIFEALSIPHAQMNVFFNKSEAVGWLKRATFPLVFKLRCGAGSSNVFLLNNLKESNNFLKKMFGRGIKPRRPFYYDFKTKISKHFKKGDWKETVLRIHKTIDNIAVINSQMPREKNYFLVQEYIPGNDFDTRVTILGDKAFAFRRFNRSNDFKASGSGNIDYEQDRIDLKAIELCFQAAKKLGSVSMAFDILFTKDNKPLILEMSYSFIADNLLFTGGYWDSNLVFHSEVIRPEDVIFHFLLT